MTEQPEQPVRPEHEIDEPFAERRGVGRPRQPIAHGTNAGANAHRKRGEKPCDACRLATNEYQKAWRRRSGRTDTVRVPLSILRDAAATATGPTQTALLSLIDHVPERRARRPVSVVQQPEPEPVEQQPDEPDEPDEPVEPVEPEPDDEPEPDELDDDEPVEQHREPTRLLGP